MLNGDELVYKPIPVCVHAYMDMHIFIGLPVVRH